MALSSDHGAKFLSLKDLLVAAELLLRKLLLCLEGSTDWCTEKGDGDNSVIDLLSDGLSLLQKWAALPSCLRCACRSALWVQLGGGGESVTQGILLENKGKRSPWYPGFQEPAWARCFEYGGLEGEHLGWCGWVSCTVTFRPISKAAGCFPPGTTCNPSCFCKGSSSVFFGLWS